MRLVNVHRSVDTIYEVSYLAYVQRDDGSVEVFRYTASPGERWTWVSEAHLPPLPGFHFAEPTP